MSARFLVRFDDICPTMNWMVWEEVESILTKHDIVPILAIVPDNRDPKLLIDTPWRDFWERVRRWQARGWTIAMHGYQHIYETRNPGLLGLSYYSEFAGLPYLTQKNKIERALAIFASEDIRVDAWAAPAHTFDAVTVQVLSECGVRVISDGFYWRPVIRMGMLWIPQQIWRFRSMPGGVWTVCFHHNSFSKYDIAKLEADIVRYKSSIVSFDTVVDYDYAKLVTVLDEWFAQMWSAGLRLKRKISWL